MSRLGAIALVLAFPAGAAWVRLTSAHFELYTDIGEGKGRAILERLELARHAFAAAPGAPPASPLPVRVLLFGSARDFRPLRPSESTVGFFQGGPERNYIVLEWAGEETGRVALHEHVHLILNHATVSLPRWLEEGLAEFYSTLQAERDAVVIGAPVVQHLDTLRRSRWLDANTLAAVTRDSPFYSRRELAALFYAQSWALVHMLSVSEAYRRGMPRFAELLEQEGAAAAFQQAFGKTLEAALAGLARYVSEGRFVAVRVALEPGAGRQTYRALPVSEEEALQVRAELLLDMGRAEEAERLYRRLQARTPDLPSVHAGLGAVALSRRDYAAARRHLERAIELGASDARTHFEYAMLLRESGGPSEAVLASLRKAVSLNPQFAEAHFMLGGALLGRGRRLEAIEHLKQAAALLPRQSSLWRALALALHESGRNEEARRAAWRALQTAQTEADAEMARAALQKAGQAASPRATARTGVTTPSSWEPRRGDKRVAGQLIHVDCLSDVARLFVRVETRTVALLIRRPSEVRTGRGGQGGLELRCGPQPGTLAVVEYEARPDPRHGTDGDVVAIELQ